MTETSSSQPLLYACPRFSDFQIEHFPSEDELLIYDVASGNTHRSNEISLNILQHLANQPSSFDTLLLSQAQQPSPIDEDQLMTLLELFIEVGLVETRSY